MSEALEAIEDISEALEEYGSDIVLRTITKGDLSTYDPRNPDSGDTVTDIDKKALIQNQASKELLTSMPNELLNNYEIYKNIFGVLQKLPGLKAQNFSIF